MKVVSWNIWIKNKDQLKSIHKLGTNYDIIALQEVTVETVELMNNLLDYHMFVATDLFVSKRGIVKELKLVILVNKKHQVLHHQRLNVEIITQRSFWDRVNRWKESIQYQYVDVKIDGIVYRVFNSHLEVGAGPKTRITQFKALARNFDQKAHNIICGDFNIFARWYVNVFVGIAMGFSWREILTNERHEFEKLFDSLQLVNVFKNQHTYPRFRLQLDHILIPDSLKFKNEKVIKNVHGSDHYPITVDIIGQKKHAKIPQNPFMWLLK